MRVKGECEGAHKFDSTLNTAIIAKDMIIEDVILITCTTTLWLRAVVQAVRAAAPVTSDGTPSNWHPVGVEGHTAVAQHCARECTVVPRTAPTQKRKTHTRRCQSECGGGRG